MNIAEKKRNYEMDNMIWGLLIILQGGLLAVIATSALNHFTNLGEWVSWVIPAATLALIFFTFRKIRGRIYKKLFK